MVGRGTYAFSTASWKPSSSLARGTTKSAPALSSSFFMAATSSAVTGFGAAATDRSTKTLAARSATWASLTFFHFFESSERCPRKSPYRAVFARFSSRALVPAGG